MSSGTFRDFIAWQKAISLVVECYRVSEAFPKSEAFGLTSQLRRSAVSVPANIAEGQARKHPAEFRRFLTISCGSLAELETHLLIALRLGYLVQADADKLELLTAEVGRLLGGLIHSLRDIPRR